MRDEEQEYYHNMPENMQGGDKGQKAEENAAALETAVDNLNNIESELIETLGSIDAATE